LIDQFHLVLKFLQSYEIMRYSVRYHFYSSPVKPNLNQDIQYQ
jgi:hypothetical protein